MNFILGMYRRYCAIWDAMKGDGCWEKFVGQILYALIYKYFANDGFLEMRACYSDCLRNGYPVYRNVKKKLRNPGIPPIET